MPFKGLIGLPNIILALAYIVGELIGATPGISISFPDLILLIAISFNIGHLLAEIVATRANSNKCN
ncbi:hypothetical protein [Shewanella mangrovisoli]|uniref:Uncharacterized protein n=1 Tax=Shewanella mangrovisoli TaxID=2864211 RepID=A0ABV4VH33_9GAMM